MYAERNFAENPFAGKDGPSESSWARDANDLGFKHVNFEVKKEEKDEIKEFKDLFSMGKKEFQTTT